MGQNNLNLKQISLLSSRYYKFLLVTISITNFLKWIMFQLQWSIKPVEHPKPSGHTMNLRQIYDVVVSPQFRGSDVADTSKCYIKCYIYDVARRRIYEETVTSQICRNYVTATQQFRLPATSYGCNISTLLRRNITTKLRCRSPRNYFAANTFFTFDE